MKYITILLFFHIGLTSIIAQSILIDSLRLNDKIPYIIKLEKLKTISKIDSITPIPILMDMALASSLIFVGNTSFEYYKENNNCHLSSIIFDDKIKTVSVNSYSFDKNTKFQDLKRLFPTDCSIASPIKIHGDDRNYSKCNVRTINAKGEKIDSQILFFFLNDKLKRIDLWEPI